MGENREGPLFPFWATLALELLARATLAKVHPALLADPQAGENILHAFGYRSAKNPKSIPVKTVFARCQTIIPDFTEDEFKSAMVIIERRNEELHSGAVAFDDVPTRLWLADYFRICNVLLPFQNRTFNDYIGSEEAAAAVKMIEADREETIHEVKEAISKASKDFKYLSEEDQKERKQQAEFLVRQSPELFCRVVSCPACEARGLLSGERVSVTDAQLYDEMIVQNMVVLPTNFRCFSCGLRLEGHGKVDIAGFGGQYQVEESFDPVQYYGVDFDPADFFEPEYGND